MDSIVKYDKNGKPLEVEDADIEKFAFWESISDEAVDNALKELYDQNIPSVHGDKIGIYEISPNGKKTYLSEP